MNEPQLRRPRERKKAWKEALEITCEEAFRKFLPVGIIRTRAFEEFLRQKIQDSDNNITVIFPAKYNIQPSAGESPDSNKKDGKWSLVDHSDGTRKEKSYDLIVVCEGANSETRQKVGIVPIPLSRERKQISGEVKLKRHGMIIQYQHAKRLDPKKSPTELLLSLVLSTDEKETTCWVIGDVSSEGVKKINEAASQSKEAKEQAEEEEFRDIASRTMLDTDQNIRNATYTGVVQVKKVEMFGIQARISPTAYAGENLILAGDAVGEGHWSVGGGMHVAGMFHQRHLEKLAADLSKAPDNRLDALQLEKYSHGVLADTTTWISFSIADYYLSIPADVVRDVFKDLVKEGLNKPAIRDKVPDLIKERVAAVYFD